MNERTLLNNFMGSIIIQSFEKYDTYYLRELGKLPRNGRAALTWYASLKRTLIVNLLESSLLNANLRGSYIDKNIQEKCPV